MKTRFLPHRPRVAAYTLIELLTVIAIIAILMSLLLVGLGEFKNTARRASAKAALGGIIGACKNFAVDYGKFPSIEAALIGNVNAGGFYAYGDTGAGKCAVNNEELFDSLRAIDRGANKGHAMNLKRQVYLSGKVATGGANPRDGFCDGVEFPGMQGRFMDSWGAQYCVILCADGSGTIDMSRFFLDLAGPAGILQSSAAGFSMGQDGKRGGKGYEGRYQNPNINDPPDDIVSWK